MARNKLSETKVKALSKPGIFGDGDGLWIRVHKSGSKNWLFIFRRGKDRHEIGLGGFGNGTAPVSVALAREKADTIREKLARGEDPLDHKKLPKVITFKHCMEELLTARENSGGNAKHEKQWSMTLREYAKPLHEKAVADLVIGDIKACLMPHWTARPETADRLRSRIQAVIDFAIAHEWRRAANPARWRGLLDKVMPPRQKSDGGHHAALSYEQVPVLMKSLRAEGSTPAKAVEFVVLTAARIGEVRNALWSEIDLVERVWTVPPEKMKAGKQHRVPLVDRAVTIMTEMKDMATSDVVFEGERSGRPVSETVLVKALRAASPDKAATLHGLRSSFRDWAGDCTSHPREIAEAALAHATGDETEQAYRRSDALAKRRALMSEWEAYCSAYEK